MASANSVSGPTRKSVAPRRADFHGRKYPFRKYVYGVIAARQTARPQVDFQRRLLPRHRRHGVAPRAQGGAQLAGQADQVAPGFRVGRAALEQQPVDAVQAVVGVELLAAQPAAFQQGAVAAFAVLGDPIFDDRPRLADAPAIEDEPVFVPEVADHRGPPQLHRAARTAHAHLFFEFGAQGVDDPGLAEALLEAAQPFDGVGLAETADEFAETVGGDGAVRPGRAHQGGEGGELLFDRQPAVEQQSVERRQQGQVDARQPRQYARASRRVGTSPSEARAAVSRASPSAASRSASASTVAPRPSEST